MNVHPTTETDEMEESLARFFGEDSLVALNVSMIKQLFRGM